MGGNVETALRQAAATLQRAGIERARVEAELLLAHRLGMKRLGLLAHPERELTAAEAESFEALVRRRAQRFPLPYLTGEREFMGLRFEVNPDVLIPRPETEVLVEAAIAALRTRHEAAAGTPDAAHLLAVDVGTGSGAIAVSLAHFVPQARVLATDLSVEACAVARRNAAALGVAERVTVFSGDLLAPLAAECGPGVPPSRRATVICANLPYIPTENRAALAPEVRDWEPSLALLGGPGGLEVVARLLEQAPDYLCPGGRLFLEIGPEADQAGRLVAQLEAAGGWQDVAVLPDLAGLTRVVTATRHTA